MIKFTKSRVCGAIKSARNGSKYKGRGDDDLDRGQIEHTQKSSNGAIKLSLLLLATGKEVN